MIKATTSKPSSHTSKTQKTHFNNTQYTPQNYCYRLIFSHHKIAITKQINRLQEGRECFI